MTDVLQGLVSWVGAHPHWAGAIVALVAFAESLAFLGLLVPGAAVMFAAGALVASGSLGFWPICLAAIAGAVVGDGLSFWLGHRYRRHIADLWPFRKHPDLLWRGESFFLRHGGKSILLGRFVGPVRPVVPVVAGMLDMRPLAFYLTNVVSALAWAPAYLLPGMAFGASLALAGAVAGRLALLLAGVVLGAWIVAAGIRQLARNLGPPALRWGAELARWAREHPAVAWLLGDLLDPERPPGRGLLLWSALLVGGVWLFSGVLQDVLSLDPLVGADRSVRELFQNLRAPAGDRLMAVASELGDATVLGAVAALVVLWLLWKKAWPDLAYFLAAVVFGLLTVAVVQAVLHLSRPPEAGPGAGGVSFPSGHATLSLVVYGFVAVLAASELRGRWRSVPYAAAGVLVAAIAGGRLYLGAHRLSEILAGLALGTTWLALSAIARQRHRPRLPGRAFAPAVAAVLVVVGALHVRASQAADLARYAVREPLRTMTVREWRAGGWRRLPAHRVDLRGVHEEPMNLQWAGDLAAIRAALAADGWREPLPPSARNALRWLLPAPELADLPLLPEVHDGRYESIRMIHRAAPGGGSPVALRLWAMNVRLEPGGVPLWVGSVARLRLRRLPLLAFPVTGAPYRRPAGPRHPLLPAGCRAASAGGRTALLCAPPARSGPDGGR